MKVKLVVVILAETLEINKSNLKEKVLTRCTSIAHWTSTRTTQDQIQLLSNDFFSSFWQLLRASLTNDGL